MPTQFLAQSLQDIYSGATQSVGKRDRSDLFSTEEAIRHRYEHRYVPGQKLYLTQCNPKQAADAIVDNNDIAHPSIVFHRRPQTAFISTKNLEPAPQCAGSRIFTPTINVTSFSD